MKFDVSIDPWIPIIHNNGKTEELGLRDVLAQAHLIRAIVDPMPTVEFGLHRLLVAFILDIFQPRKMFHWNELWNAKAFDSARLDAYFATNVGCFDLFDSQKPFLQTADVVSSKPKNTVTKSQKPKRGKEEELKKPLSVLLPSLPTGVNALHFHHQHEEDFGICAAAAARLLTAVGPFAINIGKGPGGDHMPSSVNGTPPIFLLPTGQNLWQTLLFNTPVQRQALNTSWGEETPAWRDPNPARLELKKEVGLVEGLTWRPRQVRLLIGDEGICDLTGTQGPLVREILWAQGFLSVERLSETEKKAKKQPIVLQWHDPNVAYFTVDDTRNTVTQEEGKEFWRDTAPLLFLQKSDGPKKRRLPNGKLQMVLFERPTIVNQWAEIQSNHSEVADFKSNFYCLSTNKAKVEEWQKQELNVRAPLIWKARLHNEAQQAMEEAETVFYCLKWAIKKGHRQFSEKNDTSLQSIVQKVKAGDALPSATDKKNPSRYYAYLRRIENASLMFWRELHPHYNKFLDLLAEDHKDIEREIERQKWLDKVRDVGWKTLAFALDDLDGTAEGLERQTRAFKMFKEAIFTIVSPEKAAAKKAAKEKAKASSTVPNSSEQLSLI